ncbi:MAG: hypothetical protein A2Z81_06340 [Omnitrophica WOR_2 bacterium GWA2_45_18]|nr:MAG: hypothetical protein A2Z81_06340 [Omnitrophica WOR_2 bacterium GWA2_45_18]
MTFRRTPKRERIQYREMFANIAITLAVFLFLTGSPSPVLAAPIVRGELGQVCRDTQLGVTFSCDKDWTILPTDNAFFVIISLEPEVSLIVSKTQSRIVSLEQLTRKMLEDMDRYAEGFQMERLRLAGRDAVLVKAYAKGLPEVRLQDYFFLNEGNLYSVFVLVKPADQWEAYKFILKKVVDSFNFSP